MKTDTHPVRMIVEKFPSVGWLASELGVEDVTIRNWYNRKPYSIPATYWPEIIRLARSEGRDLDYPDLVAANAHHAETAA